MTLELILYLEPSKSSTLLSQVQNFYDLSRNLPWSDNEALKYPVHTTMVGFFDDPTTVDAFPTRVTTRKQEQLIEFLDRQVAQHNTVATETLISTTTFIQGLVRPTQDSLLISIKPSPFLLDLIQSLKENFPELGLRLKRINHISLCYWDQQNSVLNGVLPEQDVSRQCRQWIDQAILLANEQIPLIRNSSVRGFGNIDGQDGETVSAPCLNDSWDLVFYSIQNRDKNTNMPYPLVELKRWTLS
ncbi:hypothetical protein BGX21_010343 [Mortierella sp. AD011]|nr:hypothetical protein BGX21_010343 [Mortierella sp. AD011]